MRWIRLLLLAVVVAGPMSAQEVSAVRPVISEFLASNAGGLADEDGDTPDWIEIHNPGPAVADLGGWFLTDSEASPKRWRFPAPTPLVPGARLVVFASGKDRTNSLRPLHTSFALDASGGYLALVEPDGVTVASAYRYGPQRKNVSFGRGRPVDPMPLVAVGAGARLLIPSDASAGLRWTGADAAFDDSAWTAVTTGVGFDRSDAAPGLLAYWDFNDVTVPAVAKDGSGNHRDGTLKGVAFTADAAGRTGKTGDRALDCKGTGNLGVAAAAAGMFDSAILHDEVTLSLWIFGGTQQPSPDSVFWASPQADGGGNRSLNAHVPWSDQVVYWDTGCCDPAIDRVSVGVPDPANWRGRWDHYAFVKRGGKKQVWLGGKLLFEGNNTGRLNPIRSFMIGAGPGMPYHGRIDDFSVWDVALDPSQIGALSAGASPSQVRRLTPLIATDIGVAMSGIGSSAYLRIPFTAADLDPAGLLLLRMRYDDGFVAYVDGTEVARRGAPASAGSSSAATSARPAQDVVVPEEIEIPAAGMIHAGTNVLAIHALNASRDDATFLVVPELLSARVAEDRYFPRPTPGAPNDPGVAGFVDEVRFEPGRGLFSAPVDVRVWTDTAGATLVYTTNGTVPSPTNGVVVPGPGTVLSLSRTTVLRAAAFLDGFAPGAVATRTYLFPASVAAQQRPKSVGTTWPGGAPTDFTVDARVVDGALPGYEFTNALTSLPTLSIVLPEPEIFGPGGIYANSGNHGDDWERSASIEWIQPDGATGFAVDAGLRIHGNISRDKGFTPKHGFNLVFRDEHGPSRLDFPIFPGSPARGFKRLVLRAGSTDTWPCVEWDQLVDGVKRWYRKDASYIRDQWVRDAQIAMGQPSSHGTFAQLYLNGIYWGLYNVCERPDDDFAALHLGGQDADYDVLADFAEVHAGDSAAFGQLMSLAGAGLSGAANYQRLMGNNADGTRNPGYPVLLDVTNLVDYMLLSIFIGSDDWPNHNWWAARRRDAESTGFKFFVWDQEISINSLVKRHSSWGPIYAEADVAGTPTYVYARCRANAEFRQLFADRVQKHLFGDGALGLQADLARWTARSAEVDRAVVAESARWGDHQRPTQPFRREVEWLKNDRWMRETFFPSNQVVALKRFRDAKLFPLLDAPAPGLPGGLVAAGSMLTITNPNAAGTLYFTIDGTDPRRVGGAVAASAAPYSAPVVVDHRMRLRARVKDGAMWSALVEAEYFVPQDHRALQVSELHYHPPIDGDASEFIELQNTGPDPLDVGGLTFTSGITAMLPEGKTLAPGAFLVLARDAANYARAFPGAPLDGLFIGKLDHGGERLTLAHPLGSTVFSFAYDDRSPWPTAADGGGSSLQRRFFLVDAGDAAAWVAASPTPGAKLDPASADSDGDGLPDLWEEAHGTDRTMPDGAADPDGDGQANLAEYQAGTDPQDPASVLRIEVAGPAAADGTVRLRFLAVAGRTYRVQVRAVVAGAAWTDLSEPPPTAENGPVTFSAGSAGGARFFRVLTPPR